MDATNELIPTTTEQIETPDDLFDFDKSQVRHKQIITSWSTEIMFTERNRSRRNIDLDVKELRDSGLIAKDETMIPSHLIDKNIRREQPPYLNFLRNSRRLATFSQVTDRTADCQRIEEDFTRGMTYSGWETPLFKELDGSQTHGWDAIELVFDTSKPLHVAFEHIGHDKLLFPKDAINIQTCEMVLRVYSVTVMELNAFVSKFGFDKEQVQKIKDTLANKQDLSNAIIYKRYCKYNDVVYVSWFANEYGTTAWLKAPTKLFLGVQRMIEVPPSPEAIQVAQLTGNVMLAQPTQQVVDEDETMYPIYILPYNQTEQQRLVDHRGRAFLDYPTQEATTALWTNFVNGTTRASNLYASPKKDTEGGRLKKLDVTLEPNHIYNQALDFWAPPYPNGSVIDGAMALDVANSNESGQVNYAATNKKGSRNTATEIQSAAQQQQLLTSVQLTLFSTHIRDLCTAAWRVVQSRAALNIITFLVDPMTGKNDVARISLQYEIRAAGDIDVIQRQEKLKQMQEFWPVVANTPLSFQFLKDMLMIAFPDSGEKYAAAIDQAQSDTQLIGALLMVIKGSLTPEEVAALDPAAKANMQQILMQAAARVSNGGNPSNTNGQVPPNQLASNVSPMESGMAGGNQNKETMLANGGLN